MPAWPEDDWERTVPPLAIPRNEVDALLGPLGPASTIQVLTSGKANTILRVDRDDRAPLVIRAYQRDLDALARERALWARVGELVPIPACLATGTTRTGHPVAVLEYVDGISPALALRDHPDEAEAIGHAVGATLAGLTAHPVDELGLYAPDLTLARRFDTVTQSYEDLIRWSLRAGRARHRLGPQRVEALLAALPVALDQLVALEAHRGLAHADYKPSNLLVAPDPWRVVGVLDWEFACPFTPMLDVALFFRHRDRWPTALQTGFEDGYQAQGGALPDDWREVSQTLDLMNLVGFLNASGDRPRLFAAVLARIDATVAQLRP